MCACGTSEGMELDTTAPDGGGGPIRVKVNRIGAGFVRSEPMGIACEPDCDYYFPVGTTLKLIAEPSPPARFGTWSLPCTPPDVPECTVELDRPLVLNAQFFGSGSNDGGVVGDASFFPDAQPSDAGVSRDAGAGDGGPVDDAGDLDGGLMDVDAGPIDADAAVTD